MANKMNAPQDELLKAIKKIVHDDTPDHFMSDHMLEKPDQIMRLIKQHDDHLLAAVLGALPEDKELSPTQDWYSYETGFNEYADQARQAITQVFERGVK